MCFFPLKNPSKSRSGIIAGVAPAVPTEIYPNILQVILPDITSQLPPEIFHESISKILPEIPSGQPL